MTPIRRVLERLSDAKQQGNGYVACCPAHDDHHPSLSIREAEDGVVLLKCFAGCETEKVLAACDLNFKDLKPTSDTPATKQERRNSTRQIAATYDYQDEARQLDFQSVRYEPKDFRLRRRNADGGWDWSAKGARTVPYRLPDLRDRPSDPVFVVEGEKDVDSLSRIGILATCNAKGAGKWTREHSEFLRGRRVIILADNDESGRNHAELVATLLHGIAQSLSVVDLPGLPERGMSPTG